CLLPRRLISLFLFTLPRPPRFTLFPYTTLFRSLDAAIELANAQPFGLTSGIQTLDEREITRWVDRIDAGNLYVNRPITGAIVGRDRKSTRLNSSHVSTSYAVFC